MQEEFITNENFINLLLTLVCFEHNKVIYYSELGSFILECKKNNRFNKLLTCFTFNNLCDYVYYQELISPIEEAVDNKMIKNIDVERIIVSGEYDQLTVLKQTYMWVDEMRLFLKEYGLYIHDIYRYLEMINARLKIYNDNMALRRSL
ncbi:MAG: hypothetical protein E7163_05620 [Firmicutes bacterium]|nr:hypothetical protein [Bacillota bacterium]